MTLFQHTRHGHVLVTFYILACLWDISKEEKLICCHIAWMLWVHIESQTQAHANDAVYRQTHVYIHHI